MDLRVYLKGAYVVVFGTVTCLRDNAPLPGHVPLGAAEPADAAGLEAAVAGATGGYAPGRASRARFWRLPRTGPPRRARLSAVNASAAARRRSSVVADADAALGAALAAAWGELGAAAAPGGEGAAAAAAVAAAASATAAEVAAAQGAAALRRGDGDVVVPLGEELGGFVASGAELGVDVDWALAGVVGRCGPLRGAAEFVARCVCARRPRVHTCGGACAGVRALRCVRARAAPMPRGGSKWRRPPLPQRTRQRTPQRSSPPHPRARRRRRGSPPSSRSRRGWWARTS